MFNRAVECELRSQVILKIEIMVTAARSGRPLFRHENRDTRFSRFQILTTRKMMSRGAGVLICGAIRGASETIPCNGERRAADSTWRECPNAGRLASDASWSSSTVFLCVFVTLW